MAFYKVKAMVIGSKPLGEADKLMTIFSKEKGKLKAVAKGGRRAGSSFGGRLELFAYNEFFLAQTRGLDILSQVESIETFSLLREKLELLETAAYLVKLTDQVTNFEHPHFPLFRLLLWSLHLLKDGADPNFVARIFEVKLSFIEGIFPVLDRCVRCGRKPPLELKRVFFSSVEAGIICSGCAPQMPVLRLSYPAVRCCQQWAHKKFEALRREEADPLLVEEIKGFMGGYLRDKFEIEEWEKHGVIARN